MRENIFDKRATIMAEKGQRVLNKVGIDYDRTKPMGYKPMPGVDKLFLYETMSDAQKNQMIMKYGPEAFAKFEREALMVKEKRGLE